MIRNKWGDWFVGLDSGLIRAFGWNLSLGFTIHLFK